MSRRILVILGHPDPGPGYCRALAQAYADAAGGAGHQLRRIDLSAADIPVLRSRRDFDHGAPPAAVAQAQQDLLWAEHLVIVHPLWLGTVPAVLKTFLEQVLRPDFAHGRSARGLPVALLKGRSARVIISMGMPALAFRWWYGAHGWRLLKRSVLQFCGIRPARATFIGSVEASQRSRAKGLLRAAALGRAGR